MKILHTSDWHLGKCLELHSRLPEQRAFVDELVNIADENAVDVIIVAGDIFDTANPPAEAQALFYDAIIRLCDNGRRLVLVIAGNHDSPERLTSAWPLAIHFSIVILGTPLSTVPVMEYKDFSVLESSEGFLKVRFKHETLAIITLPYPSEKRINEIIDNRDEAYSEKISQIFSRLSDRFSEDSINLVIGHFYLIGGEISRSERDITLGGACAVESRILPANAHYIALGHLHRPQKIGNAYYSGSPIQYDKSEAFLSKSVNLVEINGQETQVEKIPLRNYKPIDVWKAENISEAIEMCRERQNQECWVFLEIETDRVLLQSEIKEIRSLKSDIIEIRPIIKGVEEDVETEYENEFDIYREFEEFYFKSQSHMPSSDLVMLLKTLLEDGYETD